MGQPPTCTATSSMHGPWATVLQDSKQNPVSCVYIPAILGLPFWTGQLSLNWAPSRCFDFPSTWASFKTFWRHQVWGKLGQGLWFLKKHAKYGILEVVGEKTSVSHLSCTGWHNRDQQSGSKRAVWINTPSFTISKVARCCTDGDAALWLLILTLKDGEAVFEIYRITTSGISGHV